MNLKFLVNDKPVKLYDIPEDMLLVDILRDFLNLTGTKRGCESGVCGACSVLVDDKLRKSCRLSARMINGHAVTTIEGLCDENGNMNDVQKAFLEAGAVQCGFCTPGMIIAAEALLRSNPSPSRDEIRQSINPNLCRCTGYQQIIDAIELVVTKRSGLHPQQISEVPMTQHQKSQYTYVGNPNLVNVDGYDKVTGRAKYIGDMKVPGMLYAKVLRSTMPHARITKLDTSPAKVMKGVYAVITNADFEQQGNFGWPVKDEYILAFNKVRYFGEPIAVIAAETEAVALTGLAAIDLILEDLPVVDDMEKALDIDSAVIPEKPSLLSTGETGIGNLCDFHIVRNGDPEPYFKTNPICVDERYSFSHQEHAYLETEGALAIPEPDGSVTIYANNQSPFINRDTVAAVLGLSPDLVRVIQPPVGGAFGGKDDILYQTSAQVAKLALLTGRPVRLILTRSESMAASYKRQAMHTHLKVSTNDRGTIQAAKAELLVDSGAYASMTPLASWRATMHAAGAYRYHAVYVDTKAVYTNNGYSGAFRGFGNIQASAAIEIAVDELASRCHMDPLGFRLHNCLVEGDRTMTGDLIDHEVGLTDCLEWVRDISGWSQKRLLYGSTSPENFRRKGIGVACYFHGSGLGGEGVDFAVSTLKIEQDNSITLTSGLTDYGQGSRTVFTILAAETLGVDIKRIRVLRPDTHTAIDSGPTVASRASLVGGNAVRVAAQKLLNQLNLSAASAMGCQPEQIIRDGENFVGPDENPLPFNLCVQYAREMGFQLSTEGRWQIRPIEWDFKKGTGEPYFCYVFGAQVAEVEVNIRTGKITVTGIWAAHDAGRILYPLGALGQLYGGIVQGLGYALTEQFRFEKSIPQTLGLNTYRIPRSSDVPEITATYIQTTLRQGPFGAKNLAEPVMVGTAPAIANAVSQAVGKRIRTLPIKAEDIRQLN